MAVDFLTALPPEVALGILSSGVLTSIDIRHAARVSKAWANLVHFPALWRTLALRWGVAERSEQGGEPQLTPATEVQLHEMRNPPPSAESPRPEPGPPLTRDWRMVVSLMDLRCVQWTGRALNGVEVDLAHVGVVRRTLAAESPVPLPASEADGRYSSRSMLDFWRFKVLPEAQVAVATDRLIGGLYLIPLDGSNTSCILPPLIVTPYTHLEAEGRWIVFDSTSRLLAMKLSLPGEPDEPDDHPGGIRSPIFSSALGGNPQVFAKTVGADDQPYAFRMKKAQLAAFTMSKKAHIWDLEQGGARAQEVINLEDLPIESVMYIDFDDQYLFVAGMLSRGLTDVYAIRRFDSSPARFVWSLVCGPLPLATDEERRQAGYPPRPTEVSRKFMRLHFPYWSRAAGSDPGPGILGLYHGAIRPLLTIVGADPLARGSWAATSRVAPIEPWEAVHMDESTGTLVIINTYTLVILRDYRRLFTEPGYQLELEAYIDISHPLGTPPEDRTFSNEEERGEADEHAWEYSEATGEEDGTWDQTGTIHPFEDCRAALSVARGRALIVNQAPMVVDFSHLPTRAEELVVSLLWPRPSKAEPCAAEDEAWKLPDQGAYQFSTCAMVAPTGCQLYALRNVDDPSGADSDEEEEDSSRYKHHLIEQWDFTAPFIDRAKQTGPPYLAPWTAAPASR